MLLGYCRVSTIEQNEERQIKALLSKGIEKENIYIDKQSGKDTNREGLKALISFCRKGDTVITESISRIARNTKDFLNIIETLKTKGVEFISLKESIDTTTATGQFMLTVFSAMYQLERENILDRQREGVQIAKEMGKYKGRKPKEIDKEKFKSLCAEWREGKRTAKSIQQYFNITGTTFYRWVKEWNI